MRNILDIEGLSEHEAQRRLAEDGYNELPSSKPRGLIPIALDIVKEPMFLLLVACGIIYLTLGDWQEATMLLSFVFVIMGITFYQNRKTERALDALRDLSSPRALVIRDGVERRIAGREVVRGDVLILAEGDRVPADADILSCSYMCVDESLLTGESVPVRKRPRAADAPPAAPGGDDLPRVYSGTLVVQGKGIAEVCATGVRTELGKIGKALQTLSPGETRLSAETRRLVRNVAVIGVALCLIIVVVYGLTRHDWRNGFLAGITLAMAIMPEEFPVVLTIFLALGAWRMSRKQVLTRHVPAVETLGAATVLCVDKTGTLTQNRMTVKRIFAGGQFYTVDYAATDPLPETFHEVVEYSILASQIDPFDPMEKAFKLLGERYLKDTEHLHANWSLEQEYPLSRELLAMSNVWKSPDSREFVIAAKGAPEAITDLCHLDAQSLKDVETRVSVLARDGLRILGVAKAQFKAEAFPSVQHDFEFEFLGLIGFEDPVRPNVAASVEECYQAGIRVVMITGDYPETAVRVAQQIRLSPAEECITGPELDAMDDSTLRERLKRVIVFARVVPEQKLRLVRAFKENGEIAAMTGDGVNDAPALKAADIGIAMGGRGTDVAREASDLVLLDDDFSSIVDAVRMGRRIFDNLKKAIAYILAIHVPIAGLSLIPVLLNLPLVLYPLHIVFLELIIDPACSVVFEAEAEEADVMRRSPRNPKAPFFGRRNVLLSLMQGVMVLAIVLAVFVVALHLYRAEGVTGVENARTLTFTTLIVANLALILTNRSWSRSALEMLRTRNKALWWVLGGTMLFLGLVLYVPFIRDRFHLIALHPIDLLICFVAGLASVLWFEGLKWIGAGVARAE
jgi:Ca2+-transporting ATPase